MHITPVLRGDLIPEEDTEDELTIDDLTTAVRKTGEPVIKETEGIAPKVPEMIADEMNATEKKVEVIAVEETEDPTVDGIRDPKAS